MSDITSKIETLDWQTVSDDMNCKGYAVISRFLSNEQCDELIALFDKEELHPILITIPYILYLLLNLKLGKLFQT